MVLERAQLPEGAELVQLVFRLPHVPLPFDFRDGIERFRHQRGVAEELGLQIDARMALDWLYRVTDGAIAGSARDDSLVLVGRTEQGTRYTVRARIVPDERDAATGEPILQLSLYQIRVYGPVDVPWPVLAGRILDALPADLVVDRTLTTARLRVVRRALAWGLASLGWKVPDVHHLDARGVELREGRFVAHFANARADRADIITLAGDGAEPLDGVTSAFERFIEDLELKRHHGQIDRLIAQEQVRDALGEIYRAFDGPPRPGFLSERIIGICASQPILFDEGERVCLELLKKHGNYTQALCGLGAIALARGRVDDAAVYFERLVATLTGPGEREDATAADLALADCLREAAPEQARAALERVLERAPDHEEALAELIAIAEAEGDTRAAMPLYKRLLFSARSQDRTRDAGLRLARFALERGEPEDARVLLRVVLEASPDDLDAQMALADVEAEDGQGAEAVRILEGALRALAPQDTVRVMRVVVRLARIFLDLLGDPSRARRALWRIGDHARLGDTALRELTELAVRAHDSALALRFVELLPSSSSEWCDGQALRAEALLLRGDNANALAAVLTVLAREPDHERALRLLEKTAPDPDKRQWLVSELLESAQRATPGEPRARVLHRAALLYVSLGLSWDAIEPLDATMNEAPESPRLNERGILLMSLQRQFGLWSDYLRVGALLLPALRDPSQNVAQAREARVGLLVDLGNAALHELDDARTARGWLEEAVRLAPRHAEAHELLADCLSAHRDSESQRALTNILMRLENIRQDDATRDAARIQLAELQLLQLHSAPLAKATLERITRDRRRDPLVLQLEARIAAQLDARRSGRSISPVEPKATPTPTPAAQPTLGPVPMPPARTPRTAVLAPPPPRATRAPDFNALFAGAVAAADAGDDARAISTLRLIVDAAPDHGPARDLLNLLNSVDYAAVPGPAPAALPESPRGPQTPVAIAPMAAPLEAKAAEMDAIEAHLQEATTQFFAGNLEEARTALESVLRIDGDVVSALELLNAVAEAQGDDEGRVEVLRRLARSVFDVDAVAHYHETLGNLLESLKRPDEARDAFVQYLRLRPRDTRLLARYEDQIDANDLAEIYEAAVDFAEDAGDDRARTKALIAAARTYRVATDTQGFIHAASRLSVDEAGGDPELLLAIVGIAEEAGLKALTGEAAAATLPFVLPGAERDRLITLAGPKGSTEE